MPDEIQKHQAMIDYKQPHNYQRNVTQLLEFLLWCPCTAGKSSAVITPRFNNLLEQEAANVVIRSHGNRIRGLLRKNGIGQYDRLTRCWQDIGFGSINNINIRSGRFLKHANRDDFTEIHGIGLKTASFFIQCTREWADVAVLDTHILKWLRQEFAPYPVPTSTPQDIDEYTKLECMFIGASAHLNKSPAELDLELWKQYSNN